MFHFPSFAELAIIVIAVLIVIVARRMGKSQKADPVVLTAEQEIPSVEPVECSYSITSLNEFIDNAMDKQYRRGQIIYLLLEEIDSRFRDQRDLFIPLAWKSGLSTMNERLDPSDHCPALMQVRIIRDNED